MHHSVSLWIVDQNLVELRTAIWPATCYEMRRVLLLGFDEYVSLLDEMVTLAAPAKGYIHPKNRRPRHMDLSFSAVRAV